MFLPTTGVLKSTEKLNRKRRFILSSMLNGYINTPNIQHFCPRGCCRNDAETFAYAALFLTWAVVPFACPTLCRKSWIGQLATLNFVGVLEGHHNLFAKLMTKFFGKPVAPVQIVEEASSDPWLQALQDEVSRPGPHRVEEGRGPDDNAGPAGPSEADPAPEGRDDCCDYCSKVSQSRYCLQLCLLVQPFSLSLLSLRH